MIQQVVYLSSAAPGLPVLEALAILEAARRNNNRDSITGLLYSDGDKFLQALEGPREAIHRVLARIEADPRHFDITILSRRELAEREFGSWAMAHHAPGMDAEIFLARVAELVATASPSVRATFEGLGRMQYAA